MIILHTMENGKIILYISCRSYTIFRQEAALGRIRIARQGGFSMAKRERKEGVLERCAQALDLPAEAVGIPRLELVGRYQLRMENHKGILAYGTEEVMVNGGKLVFRVKGSDLELKAMTADELLIVGKITSVEVE